MAGPTTWELLFIDDDVDVCRQAQEFLEGEFIADPDDRLQVETLTDFPSTMDRLEAHRFDLLILDVRLGPHDEVREEFVLAPATLDVA